MVGEKKLKVSFICSEYNPFHNGHKYHIDETKKSGCDAVVCIMSGNFVQRGDIAVCEKHIRAKTAVLSGADIVIELPLKYAVSTASYFADGFIKTAAATGLSGEISFGAGYDAAILEKVSSIIYSAEAEEFALSKQTEGLSYPKAIAEFLRMKSDGKEENVLSDPNSVLAMEYIRARNQYFPSASVNSVIRTGVSHDSFDCSDTFTSAGNIRRIIYEGVKNGEFMPSFYSCRKFLPENAYNTYLEAYSQGAFPSQKDKFGTAAFSRLINMSEEDFLKINNVNQGLENRLTDAVKNSCTLENLYEEVKTKRYTHSRIRQIIMSAVLGVTKKDLLNGVSYIRVLAFNDKGREVLHEMKKTALLPVIMNLSQADLSDKNIARDAKLDYLSGKLFSLCLFSSDKNNPEYEIPPVYIK